MNLNSKNQDDVLTEDTRAFDEKLSNESSELNLRDLQLEKENLDQRYNARLEELEMEKREQETLYNDRIDQFRNEDDYKDKLLKSQIDKIDEERNITEGRLNHKRDEILNDSHKREALIKEKIQDLKTREEEKDSRIQEKISELDDERNKKVDKRLNKIRDLQEEIRSIEEEYRVKIMEVSRDMNYKKDILRERQEIDLEIDAMKKDSDLKIRNWQQEKLEQEDLRRERESTLKEELASTTAHASEKVARLEALKRQQLEDINDRVQVLLKEKMKFDELYNLKIEKLRQDAEFKNQEQSLQEQIKQQESLYHNKLSSFEKRRIEREEYFEEESRQELITGLIPLKEMKGYRVAKGDIDVRGWNVLGSNNDKIGKVKELIIDPEQMKVRYLDIKVDNDLMDDDERHLLIPIGVATLDDQEDNVLLPTLDLDLISKLPQMTGKNVTRDYEHTLLTALSKNYNPELYNTKQFYDQSDFDDNRFFNSKRRSD